MKYIKSYESINNKPKRGNYILMKYPFNTPSYYNKSEIFEKIKNFIENNIGIVYNILPYYDELDTITSDLSVLYDNVPIEIRKFFIHRQGGWTLNFNNSKIKEFATSKKKLELKIAANKFNL